MADHTPLHTQNSPASSPPADSEGGLRAPAHLSFWGKLWWWFDFLILVKLARLRFIAILVVIGLLIVKWDVLTAYYERWTRPSAVEHASGAETEYYCPMHPNVIRENAKEKCPICFMPLSRRAKSDGHHEALPPGIANRVQLSPYRVVLAGIKTWNVAYEPLSKEITTVGTFEFDERASKQITALVKGRLDKLLVNETGEMVHKGDVLALLYSQELQVTVQNLIDARSTGNTALVKSNRDRLANWGISDDQIDEIVKTGKANSHLKIRSPADGHVIKKYVKELQHVEEGSPLYDIVDLSTVWIQAQVYEEDMAFLPSFHTPLKKENAVKVGLPITATTRAYPGQIFEGKLTFVWPHVDQETRSVVVRFEMDNPGHKLRPGSSATVKIKVPPRQLEILSKGIATVWSEETATSIALQTLSSPLIAPPPYDITPSLRAAERQVKLQQGLVLAVPESAVIDTGAQRLVYRQIVPGEYEGVIVELAPRMVDSKDRVFYPVLHGLAAGDCVVTAGAFLVDAETRLNPAAGSIYFGGSSGSKTGSGAATVRPSTPDEKSLQGRNGG